MGTNWSRHLGALGLLALGLCLDCGLQRLPGHYPVPEPGGSPVDLVCRDPARAAEPTSDGPPELTDLRRWPHRDGAFADGQPIGQRGVRAKDVHGAWTEAQREAFPSVLPAARARSLVPIGGSYWWDTEYPVVKEGTPWVSSRFMATSDPFPASRGEEATGTMWTSFAVASRFLRVEIGGDEDPGVGIELLVEAKENEDFSSCDKERPRDAFLQARPALNDARRFVPVFVRRGRGRETVEPFELRLDAPGCELKGRSAVLRVFDVSRAGHVNVGAIETADAPLRAAAKRPPVWGFADFHTHPTAYIGFGGLHGIHTIWGGMGGAIRDYVGPDKRRSLRNLVRDIPPCDDPHKPYSAHHGGLAAPTMINVSEGRSSDDLGDLADPELADLHGSQGGPTFRDFPDFRRGAHQQYHVTQIHRAYLGGLRLMSALAVQNRGLEYGMGWVVCGADGKPTVDTTADLDVVRAHVQAMRELADLNRDWMQIAYTPDEARAIIGRNKLAVILGAEVGQLGQLDERSVAQHVDELVGLGIRQVVLVHGMDNLLAGTALFVDLYNTVSDWLNRDPRLRDQVQPLSGITNAKPFGDASFFTVTTDPSPLYAPDTQTDRILFRLANPRRIVLSDVFPHPDSRTYKVPFQDIPYGSLHPFVNTAPIVAKERGVYDGHPVGHRNTRGLTGRGKEFLATLAKRGVLVDFAHLSDRSVADALETLDEHQCGKYPFLISHAHFRHLAFTGDYSDRLSSFLDRTRPRLRHAPPMSACLHDQGKCDPVVLEEARRAAEISPWLGPGSVSRGNLPREFDIATPEVEKLATRKGALGVFLGQGPIDGAMLPKRAAPLPFANDCAGSSKSFAMALRFAGATMSGGAIGLASDFALIRNVSPRFGENACSAYLDAGSGSASGAQLLETLLDPDQYRFDRQEAPITYSAGTETCDASAAKNSLGAVACGPNEPLDPYVMGTRVYDFNVDGLAHFGLVPDMLQDVANVLRSERDLDRVFRSAEGFLETWERARSLVGCDAAGAHCAGNEPPAQDPRWCGDACPKSWNRGAPLQSVASLYGECKLGSAIRFPLYDETGTFVRNTEPKYVQHASTPKADVSSDLTDQGDWGVFPIETRQLWTCGSSSPKSLGCPPEASYVKVRRVLDATIGDQQNCHWLALPPETGNRSVIFDCLAGPPDRPEVAATPVKKR